MIPNFETKLLHLIKIIFMYELEFPRVKLSQKKWEKIKL